MKIARSHNTKVTDLRPPPHGQPWKVVRVVYENDDNPDDYEYDRSKWVNYNQFHCIIQAECPETSWPSSSPGSMRLVNGVAMYYDDPRRKWNWSEAYGSIAEVERMSCKGGHLTW